MIIAKMSLYSCVSVLMIKLFGIEIGWKELITSVGTIAMLAYQYQCHKTTVEDRYNGNWNTYIKNFFKTNKEK